MSFSSSARSGRLAEAAEGALPKLEACSREWETSWRTECTRRIEAARAVDLTALDDEALRKEGLEPPQYCYRQPLR